jgi:hypothetical protein
LQALVLKATALEAARSARVDFAQADLAPVDFAPVDFARPPSRQQQAAPRALNCQEHLRDGRDKHEPT